MLLSIDPHKVAQKLEEKPPAYFVTPYNLEMEDFFLEAPTTNMYSVTPMVPPELERARERVLNLRQRLADAGVRPFGTDELEAKIDEIRGRR